MVIGAGIVGSASALLLRRDGWEVTLVDRAGPGEGTSFGNASVIAPDSVVPTAAPGLLKDLPRLLSDPLGPLSIRWRYLPRLTPWLLRFAAASRPQRVEAISQALGSLLERSLQAHLDLAADLGIEDMIKQRGWLMVAESPAVWEAYQRKLALQRKRGVSMTLLTGAELRQYEPSLNPVFTAGAYFPGESHVVENYRYVRKLAAAAQEKGVVYKQALVKGFALDGSRVSAVKCEGEALTCDAVVLAAGAWSKGLSRQLGAKLPLDTERGYHLTLPQPGVELRLPVCSLDCGFVATPLESGMRLAGTDELGGLSLPPNWKRADVLLTNAKRWFNDLDARDATRWMGFRPSFPDSLPVIDRSPRARNAVLAFGHGHLGLTMGPRTAELVADLLAERPSDIDLAPFGAGRF
ncbi:MAG: FAD-binding oxidoreductase [Rhodospirillales bacterium]